MNFLIDLIIACVAFEHVYFMILEMFFWDKPLGLKSFGLTKDFAEQTKVLAFNQGLYNGFLAAGLIWALMSENNKEQIALFFLICVVFAGIIGAYSTKKAKIFYIQSIPALIGLIFILLF
ncbi:DUF1304 domain-containing protein [Namhaeicola litoreus]|uniref:DUF1304 domain-containing protein n=1 Tax=Namhaeicola litoreus TaxID=1052145 RepID=A0ABW3XXA1_9FLAO